MEITKAKNFDTNGVAEFESVDEETHEVTPDMKYIKWPSKKRSFLNWSLLRWHPSLLQWLLQAVTVSV